MLVLVAALSFALPVQEAPVSFSGSPSGSLSGSLLGSLLGTYALELDPAVPMSGTATASSGRLGLWTTDAGEVRGGLRIGETTALVDAVELTDGGALRIALTDADGDEALFSGERTSAGFAGTLTVGSWEFALRGTHRGDPVDDDLRLEVDRSVELPRTVDRDGLPDELEAIFQPALERIAASEGMVGVSVAIILEFEVADVRSLGWQDFARRIPASGSTRYRWASISKPVTAVAALQLVEDGRLDLDADVRGHVPEFPEKKWPVTPRHLLCHQAGIVHYQHDPIRTQAEYEDADPFRDAILALDMFRESPLLFEPGSAYSYSTHGYALLGAVVERAGGAPFARQVHERIVQPLGMTTMRPDFHHSVDIPDQTVGYAVLVDGRTFDAGDSNVAWKLAGGGFLSNVEDLARFGVGLMGDTLLEPETRERMFTPRPTASGEETGYGYGIGAEELRGLTVVGHSGAQRKTRTFLRVVPEIGVGIAVMTNTEGANVGAVARAFLEAIVQ